MNNKRRPLVGVRATRGDARPRVNLVRIDHGAEAQDEPYEKLAKAIPVSELAPLRTTFCPMERQAMLEAARKIVPFLPPSRSPPRGSGWLAYPSALAQHMSERLDALSSVDDGSAERETERLRAALEELDLEPAVADRAVLPDQLEHPLIGQDAGPVGVDVGPVRGARRRAVEQHRNGTRALTGLRAHHEVDVARVELESDASARFVQRDGLRSRRPIAGQAQWLRRSFCGAS